MCKTVSDTTAFGGVTQVRFGLAEIFDCEPSAVFIDCGAVSSGISRPQIDWFSPAETELNLNIGESISFEQKARHPNGGPLTYSWTVDSEYQANTQNWTFTPLSASKHKVKVTVSDGTLTDYHMWIVTVAVSYTHLTLPTTPYV